MTTFIIKGHRDTGWNTVTTENGDASRLLHHADLVLARAEPTEPLHWSGPDVKPPAPDQLTTPPTDSR
jgi:hypothetical protein